MSETTTREIRLCGTDEKAASPRLLSAGALSAELEAGNLRYVRFGGVEMIRAVSFIVRDKNWGTYNPEITDLRIDEDAEGFRVSYKAFAKDATQQFAYSAEIIGRADGTLRFSGGGRAVTDFLTSRTGFVVLHPIEGVAGTPARVTQTGGRVVDAHFPDLIDPVQPMMDLRTIRHSFAPGAFVDCTMEGDTFEMEDQRNWTDASYKTYVRPLALPWPYTLAEGTELQQSVTLTVSGSRPARADGGEAVVVRVGGTMGQVPALGLGLDPDDFVGVLAHVDALRALGVAHLVCHHDPRRGHGRETLAKAVEVAKTLGARPWLEAIITDVDGFEAEVTKLSEWAKELGSPFSTVLLSPAPDLKCTLPGSPWPPCPPAAELLRVGRRAFPGAQISGGMFSYFTELNRKRPPLAELDLVGFTTSPLVHAGDDRSVTESLESLPHITRSVRALCGGKPFIVGPSAIGMRDNPYGEATAKNPGNIRQAMNRNDPRQRSLLGAAWNLAYFAHFARGGAQAIALGGCVGPFGLLHTPADYPQPGFDGEGGLFPVYHIVRGLAALKGEAMRAVEISAPRNVQAFAAGNELWLANLTAEPQRVKVDAGLSGSLAPLDAASFRAAMHDPDTLDHSKTPFGGDEIELDAYAVARIRAA